MIGIIDYGLGNVQSFINSYRILGITAIPVRVKSDYKNVDKVILPGVGSFDSAMERLSNSEVFQDLQHLVTNNHLPILGVCVGLQIMARRSEEGVKDGLGWLDADVKIIKNSANLPLPHMGWNEISVKDKKIKLLDKVDKCRFYFLHSFYLSMHNQDDQIATTYYGDSLTAAVSKNNIYGCQFHPEKSHDSGLKILENFGKI